MRVFLQYELTDTGKGKFLERLTPELSKLGVDLVTENKKCDLTLSLTSWRKPSGNLPRVLRMDGVHMLQNKRIGWRNEEIAKDIKKADLVIWQSKFCEDIVGGLLCKGKKNAVIFNGMDPAEFDSVEPIKSEYKRNIVFCSKWDYKNKTPRIHKRLKDSAKIARDYTGIDKDACCWIIGNTTERRYEDERVRYTGWLDNEELKRYLKMADIGVYPAWFDWCPNAVVEGVAAGMYMIVGNNGGQAELIGDYGKVVNIDKPMTPKALKKMEVPKIDRTKIMEVMLDFYANRPEKSINPAIHITNIAKQYKKAFEEALWGKG